MDRRSALRSTPYHLRVVRGLGGIALQRAVPLGPKIRSSVHPVPPQSGAGSGGTALQCAAPPWTEDSLFGPSRTTSEWCGVCWHRTPVFGAPSSDRRFALRSIPYHPRVMRGLDGAALKPRWPLDRRLGLQSIPHHPRVVQGLGGAALTRAVPPHLDRRFSLRSHPLHPSSGAGSGAPSRIPLPVAALFAAREVPPLRFSAGGVSVAFCAGDCNQPHDASRRRRLQSNAGSFSAANYRRRNLRCELSLKFLRCNTQEGFVCKATLEVPLLRATAGETSAACFH